VGDYLFVSKYSYGYSKYSLPLTPSLFSGRIFGSLPKRGDVAVFKLPRDNSTDYIKRIIGLPGDRVQMMHGRLYINGTLVQRKPLGDYTDREGDRIPVVTAKFMEMLPGGHDHLIITTDVTRQLNDTDVFLVPEGHVFAMGDNRDNSSDSRDPNGGVGYIPLENLVGRAEFIFFSVDASSPWWEVWQWPFEIRWSRLFSGIN